MAKANATVEPTEIEPSVVDVAGQPALVVPDGAPVFDPPLPQVTASDDGAGMIEPDENTDRDAVREFLATSMQEEAKALRKLMAFMGKIEPKLTELQSSYTDHRERTARLYKLATNGLVKL